MIGMQIFDCLVKDFTFCENLQSIRTLHLSANDITTVSQLGNVTNVTNLLLHDIALEDLNGAEKLIWLDSLSLEQCSVRDFSPLNNLPRLERLSIHRDLVPYLDTLDNDNVEVIVREDI